MRPTSIILRITIIVSLFMLTDACSNYSHKKSEYFGKLPAIFAKYNKEKSELSNERELTSSIGKSLELKTELQKLKKEKLKTYKKEYKKLSFPIKMPAEGHFDYKNHTIKNIYISDITPSGRVKIVAKSQAEKDNICAFAFLQFADHNGDLIGNNFYTVLTSKLITENIQKGQDILLEGYCNKISRLADAKKMILISEKDYFNNKM